MHKDAGAGYGYRVKYALGRGVIPPPKLEGLAMVVLRSLELPFILSHAKDFEIGST